MDKVETPKTIAEIIALFEAREKRCRYGKHSTAWCTKDAGHEGPHSTEAK